MALGFNCAHAQTKTEEPPSDKITIGLADGPLLVDEVTEDADGYWYKRGSISTFLARARVIRIEPPKPPAEERAAEDVVEGKGKWKLADAGKIEEFFRGNFKRPLP